MSLTASIAGVAGTSVVAISRPDTIDQKTVCTISVLDTAGTAFYQRGQPITITDSILGTIFTGRVNQPTSTKLYPNPGLLWTLDCIADGDYLAGKRTSNKTYANQYSGTIVVDQVQRYGAAESLAANAALRWDELETDWASGTLTNTAATTNASDGNPGDGDLELALAGTQVVKTYQTTADFNSATGFNNTSAKTNSLTCNSTTALKMIAVASLSGADNLYSYVKIWSGSQSVGSNNYLIYDIWIDPSSPTGQMGVDLTFSDGTTLRDNYVYNDSQNIPPHPNNDLRGLATGQWYHRAFWLENFSGKTISYVTVASEGDTVGTYTAWIKNVGYTDSSGTIITSFFAGTLNTSQQMQNSGYSGSSISTIPTYALLNYNSINDGGGSFTPYANYSFSIDAAKIVQSSYISWDATIPAGTLLILKYTLDNEIFYLCSPNTALPNLTPGLSVASKTLYFEPIFFRDPSASTQANPEVAPILTRLTISINSAYAATKSDTTFLCGVQADWTQTGTTLTNTAANSKILSLSGYTNNYMSGWSGTLYGTGGDGVTLNKQTLAVTCASGTDARFRIDQAGNAIQNFTMEADIIASAAVCAGFVYRTTGWQNNNNTYAYMCTITTTQLLFGHGNNLATGGAGTFIQISATTLTLTAGNVYHLKAVINGNTHTFYLNDVLIVSNTDSTYTAAGYVGLRVYNASASGTGYFANFGVMPALSGTWVSPSISLAGASSYGNSVLTWRNQCNDTTNCTVKIESSLNGGTSWTTCNPTVSGVAVLNSAGTTAVTVPGLTSAESLSGISVQFRITLATTTASSMPGVDNFRMIILGNYIATGTRVSPSLSLTAAGIAATTLINWNANIPTNTTLAVQTSLNSGSTWQTVVSPGDPVTFINMQPDPDEDTFTENSSADYISTHMSGGANATWTWDTANHKLTGTSGNNDILWYLTDAVADMTVSAVMDISQNAGLVVRMKDENNLYIAYIEDSTYGNSCTLWKIEAGSSTLLGSATLNFTNSTPHLFQLSAISTAIVLSMDNVTLISVTDSGVTGIGKAGMHGGTSGRFYSFRYQAQGENVSSLSLLTKIWMTSTNPTATPQMLDMQMFVSSPDIGEGIVIPSVAYQRTFIDANIDDLNKKSNYWTTWNTTNLLFQAREATPAPFVLSSLNSTVVGGQTISDVLVDSVELDNSGDYYRNRQIMRNAIATQVYVEIKTGDGSTTSWSVANPLAASPVSIVLNGQNQTFGMKNVDTGKDFYYQIGSTSIDQDSSQTVLQDTDSFAITYLGSSLQDVELDNTGQFPGTISQAMMQTIENSGGGSSSGIVDAVVDLSSTPTTVESATTQANQLLQRYGTIGRTFKCKTLRSGFAPGQQVSVFVPEFNLSNVQMLITQIDISIAQAPGSSGGLMYTWALTMMEGPNLGTWVQFFKNFIAPATASGAGGIISMPTVFHQSNVLYAEDYGTIGDGVSDDTSALQALLNAATTGTAIELAPVTYLISASLLYPGNIELRGNGATLKIKSGTALTTPVLCSADWYNNSTTSGYPVYIHDVNINGNSATSGSDAHGFVGMNYWSAYERLFIENVAGDGFRLSAFNKGGTHISNTCVESKVKQLQIRTVSGDGFRVYDDGSGGGNALTDGFIEDCIIQDASLNSINIDMCQGWRISGNHVYGSLKSGIILNKCYGTRCHANYVDGFGASGSATYIAGIAMSILDGRGSSCIGNTVGFESGTATGPFTGISITGAGSAPAVCEIGYNTVNGNSASASNGYVIQANSSQQPYSWIIYFHDNDALNVNHFSYFDTYTHGGNLQVLQHIASIQYTAVTAAAGANAGTSPPAPVLTNCSDLCGQITFGTGSGSPAIGAQVLVTFDQAYDRAPVVICTPVNDATAALRWNVTSTTTTFTYNVGVAPSASQGNTHYGFMYHVLS